MGGSWKGLFTTAAGDWSLGESNAESLGSPSSGAVPGYWIKSFCGKVLVGGRLATCDVEMALAIRFQRSFNEGLLGIRASFGYEL
jgi:hypothetical protein